MTTIRCVDVPIYHRGTITLGHRYKVIDVKNWFGQERAVIVGDDQRTHIINAKLFDGQQDG